jgi:hypothetical protein
MFGLLYIETTTDLVLYHSGILALRAFLWTQLPFAEHRR